MIRPLVFILLSAAAFGAQNDFDQLVAEIIRGAGDDAERAARLLKAARSVKDDRDASTRLLEKVFEYGIKSPAGYSQASFAIDKLKELAPSRRAEWEEKELLVLRRRYAYAKAKKPRTRLAHRITDKMVGIGDRKLRAGSASGAIKSYNAALVYAAILGPEKKKSVIARIKEAMKKQAAEQKLQKLMDIVEKDPSNVKARTELVVYYVRELNDPPLAELLITKDLDKALQTNVPLASRPVDKLKPDEWMKLGDWYHGLAPGATITGKTNVLGRAAQYYDKYLNHGGASGTQRLKAKLKLKGVTSELEKLGGSFASASLPPGAVYILTFEAKTLRRSEERLVALSPAGGGRRAVIVGGRTTKGIAGDSIELSGRTSHIDLGVAHTCRPLTVCFWAKSSEEKTVFRKLFGFARKPWANRFYLGYNLKGFFGLGLGKSSFTKEGTSYRADKNWHFYAAVWDGRTMTGFVDSRRLTAKNYTVTPEGKYFLGNTCYGTGPTDKGWRGAIDEFAMFNRALKPAEIKKIHELGKKGKRLK